MGADQVEMAHRLSSAMFNEKNSSSNVPDQAAKLRWDA